MKRTAIFFLAFCLFLVCTAFNIAQTSKTDVWDEQTGIARIIQDLGGTVSDHGVTEPSESQIKQGEDIVLNGITNNKKGKPTRVQSKYFKCTDCHNVQKETLDIASANPDDRLNYAIENQLPFLQGTTLWGAVNRTSWYNDDYQKKYAGVKGIKEANNDLREAIQVCAIECSQGRKLKQWEMDAVVAYLWSLEVKLKDLSLDSAEQDLLKAATSDPSKKQAALEMLDGKYMKGFPAHFVDQVGASREAANKLTGNPERGAAIYQLSCQHCHGTDKKITNLVLDDAPMTFRMLKRNLNNYTHLSLYQITRKGTYAQWGYKPYMPLYTSEKLSNQQLADLQSYIEQQSKN